MKDTLLASAPSLQAIQELIAKYYLSANIRLKPDESGRWTVSNAKGTLTSYVEQRKSRFRFMQPTGSAE